MIGRDFLFSENGQRRKFTHFWEHCHYFAVPGEYNCKYISTFTAVNNVSSFRSYSSVYFFGVLALILFIVELDRYKLSLFGK